MLFLLNLLTRSGVSDGLAKIIAPLILVGLALLVVFGVYYAGVLHERGIWKDKMDKYEQKLKDNAVLTDQKITKMQDDHAKVVADLETRLTAVETRKAQIKTITRKVVEYVTPKADSQCVLTSGFVWMSNLPLAAEVPGIPEGQPSNVDEATGLTASAVASTTANNYAECVARGQVITAWQEWYAQTSGEWEKFRLSLPPAPEIPK